MEEEADADYDARRQLASLLSQADVRDSLILAFEEDDEGHEAGEELRVEEVSADSDEEEDDEDEAMMLAFLGVGGTMKVHDVDQVALTVPDDFKAKHADAPRLSASDRLLQLFQPNVDTKPDDQAKASPPPKAKRITKPLPKAGASPSPPLPRTPPPQVPPSAALAASPEPAVWKGTVMLQVGKEAKRNDWQPGRVELRLNVFTWKLVCGAKWTKVNVQRCEVLVNAMSDPNCLALRAKTKDMSSPLKKGHCLFVRMSSVNDAVDLSLRLSRARASASLGRITLRHKKKKKKGSFIRRKSSWKE